MSHQDNFNWQEAALWTAGGAVVGATFGAGAEWVAAAGGAQAASGSAAAAVAATASSPTGLRVVDFLESQTNRIDHIMRTRHAWDRFVAPTGEKLADYKAIQPIIQKAIETGTMRDELSHLTYTATIDGQKVVVMVRQVAGNVLQIVDAYVETIGGLP